MSLDLAIEDYPKADEVDILLLLEGTFPFVSGGVAAWTQRFIQLLPQYRFGAIFIGSKAEEYTGLKYVLPKNLIHFEAHYIFGELEPQARTCPGRHKAFEKSRKIHDRLREKLPCNEAILDPKFYTQTRNGIDLNHFLHSRLSWDYITEMYETYCNDPSFIDYFWTVRGMHKPLWTLANIAIEAPKAKIFHSLSTGYAGFLGSMLNHDRKLPMLISEHGIYTKERRIDLLHSEWFQGNLHALQHDVTEISYFRKLWIRFFESLARMGYSSAHTITCLFEEAKPNQVECGAPEEKIKVITNGVDIVSFQKLRKLRPVDPPPVICLLGRVVAIKNIKTFIRAMATIKKELPEVEGWIAGPKDIEPEYTEECEHLIKHLALENSVKLIGPQSVTELLPKIGLLALSSISEGLPLVLLEAFAAGVPAVATDVGGCKQVIEGGIDDEDRALGHAGAIVPIANPQALADASLNLLKHKSKWQTAQQAAISRIEKYYNELDVTARYDEIYREIM